MPLILSVMRQYLQQCDFDTKYELKLLEEINKKVVNEQPKRAKQSKITDYFLLK